MESKASPDAKVVRDERTRVALLTVVFIVAVVLVWVVALGVLDRAYTPPASARYSTSPTAHVERRPVLFAICPRRGDDQRDGAEAIGVALPIASIDPSGGLLPAVPVRSDERRQADLAAFVATYCSEGTALRVLYGGAFAGTLYFMGAPDLDTTLPEARVGYGAADPVDIVENAANDLLGISDPRFGAASSGARPMQATHREEVERMIRAAVRDRFPHWQFESAGLARVRVADLDRSGESEVLASATVQLRVDAKRETTVVLFLIGEPTPAGSDEPFRLAYFAARETSDAESGFAFLDHADLTPAQFDEVVVRSDEGASVRYLVLQRGVDGWREAIASPFVKVP